MFLEQNSLPSKHYGWVKEAHREKNNKKTFKHSPDSREQIVMYYYLIMSKKTDQSKERKILIHYWYKIVVSWKEVHSAVQTSKEVRRSNTREKKKHENFQKHTLQEIMMFFKNSTNANTFLNTGNNSNNNKLGMMTKTNSSTTSKQGNNASNKSLQWKTKPLVVSTKKWTPQPINPSGLQRNDEMMTPKSNKSTINLHTEEADQANLIEDH